jgi:hypothetical protein
MFVAIEFLTEDTRFEEDVGGAQVLLFSFYLDNCAFSSLGDWF